MNHSARKWKPWSGLALVAIVSLACSGVGDLLGPNSEQATADAFATSLVATRAAVDATATVDAAASATVRALPDTPVPTSSPFPSRTPDTAATAAYEATLGPIQAALPAYGIDPSQGRLGWVHASKTIELVTYGAQDYATDYPNVVARNFVVQADVTWTTRTGLAGCGFVFRADQEQNFYGFGIARGATGVSVFDTFRGGRSVRGWETQDAPATNWQNGETNRLALVAQENVFTLFVNNQYTQQQSSSELQAGVVAFAALSESGTSLCTFNNGWLWVLDG